MSLSDAHAALDESQVGTDTGVHAEGNFIANLGSATEAEYHFNADQNLGGFTSDGKEVVFEVSADQSTLPNDCTGNSDPQACRQHRSEFRPA